MYTITIEFPNAPLAIRRTFRVSTTLDAEDIVAYCQKHKLEVHVTGYATDSVGYVKNQIDRELAFAAGHRVA